MSVRASQLGHHLVRLVKLMQVARSKAPVTKGLDAHAYAALFPLEKGPMRLSDLAACTLGDVSTVSRNVTNLANLGLITKGPDPADGRAQQLSLTDEGLSTLLNLRTMRDEWLTKVTSTWSKDDIATLAALLDRLANDVETNLNALGAPATEPRPAADSSPTATTTAAPATSKD